MVQTVAIREAERGEEGEVWSFQVIACTSEVTVKNFKVNLAKDRS